MSTKTNFKRVALVAVASLGLGVLTSVAPAFAAGGITVAANGGTADTSRGIVTSPTGTTGLTSTAKMLATGSLYVTTTVNGTDAAVAVSGATITACGMPLNGQTLTATGTLCYNATDGVITMTVVPNAGVTSFTISQFDTYLYTTEENRLTVSVVAATSVGAFSSTYSFVEVKDTATTAVDNVDDKYSSTGFFSSPVGLTMTTRANNGIGYLNFVLKDGNNNALPATSVLSASATGGCIVGFGGATTRLGASAVTQAASGYVSVAQAVANTPYKCVVTLAANGATIAARTFTLQGQVTKLVVSDILIAKSGTTTTAGLYVDAQDSAGNSVPDAAVGPVTATYNTSVTTISSSAGTNVIDGTALNVTCDAKGTNAALRLATVNASVATILSDPFSVSCAGSPVNYSASLDKASYTIGEVATLTITAKDSAGNLTWDGAKLANSTTEKTATDTAVSIAGGPLTQVGAVVSTDSFTSGVKKYKFTVGGINPGSFQLVVDLPNINSTTYSQDAVSVAYKVTTGADGGVQLADVLKAIVSLIASINKQIAALQKALLKK
jgi:hypothetical protein